MRYTCRSVPPEPFIVQSSHLLAAATTHRKFFRKPSRAVTTDANVRLMCAVDGIKRKKTTVLGASNFSPFSTRPFSVTRLSAAWRKHEGEMCVSGLPYKMHR